MKTVLRYPFLLLFPMILVLPFPMIVDSVALGLACLNLLMISVREKKVPQWHSILREPMVWIGLYVLAVDPITSLLRADFQIELRTSRLALFLVPLAFYLFNDHIPRIRKPVLQSFVLGVFLYIVYSYGYLIYFYSFVTKRSFTLNHYLKYDLSEYLPGAYHHSYLGMYMTFSIILFTFGRLVKVKWQLFLICLLILVNQVFMGGKISLILSLLVILAYVWQNSINKRLLLAGIAISSVAIVFFLNLRGLFESLNFSIANRWLSWKCSLNAIIEHPWLGQGKEASYRYLSECMGNEAVSTHNQIFNEFVNYGVFGAWILFFYWLLIKRSGKDLVFALWVGMIIAISLFENLISLQRGILFVSFFAVLFMLSPLDTKAAAATKT